MRILITGVAGFIGSNLASTLIDGGHTVIGIDIFSHGCRRNIKDIWNNSLFIFYEMDITLEENIKGINFDIAIHLATQKIPRYDNSYATLSDNEKMLKNIVNACLENEARLLFASTSDVYGKNMNIPFSEESELVLGRTDIKRWSYAVSKIYGEHYIIACSEEFGLEYTIMRLFSVYGENQNITWWGGPQGLFIQNCLEGKPIDIHGTGMQSRCFTYIEDTIDGIMRCIFNKRSTNEVFNIGNPLTAITINELANIICELTGKIVPIIYIPYSDFGKYEDVMSKIPNIDKITDMLGFKPSYSIIDGLKKTIEWQTKLL